MKRVRATLIACGVALASCSAPRLERPAGVRVSFPAAGVPLNEYFSIGVEVESDSAARISVDADMPAHKHGMLSTPIVHTLAPGHFRVDGMLFHMPGEWEVYVTVDGESAPRATIPIVVEP